MLFLLDLEVSVFSVYHLLQNLTIYLALRTLTEVLVLALQRDSSFELATHEATVLSAMQDVMLNLNNCSTICLISLTMSISG